MTKQNIWCFLVVYFSKYDELYRIDFSWVIKYLEKHKTKQIKYTDIKSQCKLLPIIFPGIINFLET
jgi:penicillin-binding protein-related factor A (putative recombinase)